MLAEMGAVQQVVERTCPSCAARVDDGADWCGQCYTRLRVTVPHSDIQRVTSMNPRLGTIGVQASERRWRDSFSGLRDLATRIGMTLAVGYGAAWCAFHVDAKWYAASLVAGGYAIWTIWRSGRRYA